MGRKPYSEREGKKIIMRDAHNDKTLGWSMAWGRALIRMFSMPTELGKKGLFKVARIFYASMLGLCLALFHISIFSRKRRRNRNLCAGRQADDCGNRDGITT